MHFLSSAVVLVIISQTVGAVNLPLFARDDGVCHTGMELCAGRSLACCLPQECLRNQYGAGFHCGIPGASMAHGLVTGGSELHSDSEEKRDNTGYDNSFSSSPHALEGRDPHRGEPRGGRGYCKQWGPHDHCIQFNDHKEKRDNTGYDNSHPSPTHAPGNQNYVFGPNGPYQQGHHQHIDGKIAGTSRDE